MSRWPDEMPTLDRLGIENLDAIGAAEAEFGMDFEFERNGALGVAVEPHQVEWLHEEVEAAAARGDDAVRLLDEAEVRAEVDSPTYLGGVWDTRGSALVHPAKLAAELARVAEELGVEIFERSPVRRIDTPGSTGAVTLVTEGGRVFAQHAVLATNVFPSLLKRNRLMTVPVYDYALMTEPLSAEQLASIGWSNRQGLGDLANQFHYYRLSRDNRILFGGYDAVYHYGRRVREQYEQRPESYERLAAHFFTTFPQLEGLRFSHRWAWRDRHEHAVLRVLRHRSRRPGRLRRGLHGPRRRGHPVRGRGHARPARAARQRAHPAPDGARAPAAVPARARRRHRHQRDALVTRPRRPHGREAQHAPQDTRRPRPGVRLMTAEPRLHPGVIADAASVVLEHVAVEPDQVVAGTPTTGHLVLDDDGEAHGGRVGDVGRRDARRRGRRGLRGARGRGDGRVRAPARRADRARARVGRAAASRACARSGPCGRSCARCTWRREHRDPFADGRRRRA